MSTSSEENKAGPLAFGKMLMGGFFSLAFITLIVVLLGLHGLNNVIAHANAAANPSAEEQALARQAQFTWNVLIGGGGFGIAFAVFLGIYLNRYLSLQIGRTVENLTESSIQVSSASNMIQENSQMLADGASQQAASLESTGASLEEMASMARHNAENAKTANELSNKTRASADQGWQAMQQLSTAIGDIRQSSDNISKIIRTIDEIAFQTNILALNAAVEAARAGEAGAGFAVVADEVRNLAQRSALAARETAEKIEDSITKSRNGESISKRVGDNLQEILGSARQLDELVAQIATASNEQSLGAQQISASVSQVDKVTQSNAANAEEGAAAAIELASQAENLRHAINALSASVGQASHDAAPSVPFSAPPAYADTPAQHPAPETARVPKPSSIPMSDDFKDF